MLRLKPPLGLTPKATDAMLGQSSEEGDVFFF